MSVLKPLSEALALALAWCTHGIGAETGTFSLDFCATRTTGKTMSGTGSGAVRSTLLLVGITRQASRCGRPRDLVGWYSTDDEAASVTSSIIAALRSLISCSRHVHTHSDDSSTGVCVCRDRRTKTLARAWTPLYHDESMARGSLCANIYSPNKLRP